jgi:hypothetical protein
MITSPGVEGENIFRILPGVRDTGEPGLFLPGVKGEDIFRILPGVRDTGKPGLFLPGVEGEDVFRILPGVPDTREPWLFYLKWRARMYSGYSPVFQTPGSQGYSTWSGGRGCILDTPRRSRHRGARVILPGVENEDVFRILPGVPDTG